MCSLKIKFGMYVFTFIFVGVIIGICLSAIYHINEANNIRASYRFMMDKVVTLKKADCKDFLDDEQLLNNGGVQ